MIERTESGRVSPFVSDILGQPDALRRLFARPPHFALGSGFRAAERFERIVLTGMGASLVALEPSWLRLLRAGLPAWHVDSARLVQDAPQLATPTTLVIAASQSGQSAELVALVDILSESGSTLLALTNDDASPLALGADHVVDIQAGVENAVSTRTFLNTLAAAVLTVDKLLGDDSSEQLGHAADAIEAYLMDWQLELATIRDQVGLPERLYLLGRGPSLAAAEYGGLILKEAAKWPVEALGSAQFRHGPLELADDRLLVIVFSGSSPAERERNLRLVRDVRRLGGSAIRIEQATTANDVLLAPAAGGVAAPLAEAVPTQLLSVAIAELQGIEAGEFRHLRKVTTIE